MQFDRDLVGRQITQQHVTQLVSSFRRVHLLCCVLQGDRKDGASAVTQGPNQEQIAVDEALVDEGFQFVA